MEGSSSNDEVTPNDLLLISQPITEIIKKLSELSDIELVTLLTNIQNESSATFNFFIGILTRREKLFDIMMFKKTNSSK